MNDLDNLNNLVKAGVLKAESCSMPEVERLIKNGDAYLADSSKTTNSREGRFKLAYDAAHAFALAALRLKGYRANNKRFAVFQALPFTLGTENAVVRVLNKCHGIRNDAEYEGTLDLDPKLLDELIRSATGLRSALRNVLKDR